MAGLATGQQTGAVFEIIGPDGHRAYLNGTAGADIAYDATSNAAAQTGDILWTHTPVSSDIRGVLVLVAQNVGVTDEINSVTYGGETMTEVPLSLNAVDAGAEDGALYGFLLGTNVPQGAQTVAIDVNGTASTKRPVAFSVTAPGDVAVDDTTILDSAGTSNPSVTLDTTASTPTAIFGVLHSGHDDPASLAAGAGYTEVLEHDYTSQTASWIRRTAAGSGGAITVDWTAASEEAGVLAVALRKVNEGTEQVASLGGEDAITGLDSPDVRESFADKVESDGGIHGAFFHGRRPITFRGRITASSATERNQKMTRLMRATNALQSDGTITWTPDGGEEQFVRFRKQQPTRFTGGWSKEFFLAVVCADPRIYSTTLDTTGDQDDATDVSVENQGSALTAPELIRITGPGVNPLVSIGEYRIDFEWTLAGGQFLDIDVGNRTVLDQSGTNRYSAVNFVTSTWGGLVPGVNICRVDFDSGASGASKIRIDWRNAWI